MKFDELRLNKPLLDAVHASGYETPTPIQVRVIPLVLKRKDVLACAQTGTGKTAAFALPILQQLSDNVSSDRKPGGRNTVRRIRSLVLAPTRELAQQISDSFSTYGRNLSLKHAAVYGGVNKNPQTRTLRGGVDILVATPGRLLDHMSDGTISLDSVEVLVLDEADRMLDMGFLPDIRRILKQVPKKRQTLFLSATMPAPIRELANEILSDPVAVEVARVSSPAESVEHWAYHVEKASKRSLLSNLLNHIPYSRALVFTRTKHGADKVVHHLMRGKIASAAIHGNKSQNARTRALDDFKSGKVGVLVATDIAARGLDVDGVSHVINFDLTDEPETYIHRIGRTGRAGASGVAMSFISIEDHENLRDIEKLLSVSLQLAGDIPGYVAPKEPVVLQVEDTRNGGGSRGKSRRSNAAPKQAPYFPKKKGTSRPPRPGRNRNGAMKRSAQSAAR
jgi:ATP-dependent RNA helicase RhlE